MLTNKLHCSVQLTNTTSFLYDVVIFQIKPIISFVCVSSGFPLDNVLASLSRQISWYRSQVIGK